MTMQYDHVWIIDNRDGSTERAQGLGLSVQHARADAYDRAAAECAERNAREGWARFVALTWRAGKALGVGPKIRPTVFAFGDGIAKKSV